MWSETIEYWSETVGYWSEKSEYWSETEEFFKLFRFEHLNFGSRADLVPWSIYFMEK